jgi:hypothetical protein
LTIRRFDQVIAAAGLRLRRKEIHPFTGSRFAGLKKLLAQSPLRDFFCSCAVYEIEKPLSTAAAGTSPAENSFVTSSRQF